MAQNSKIEWLASPKKDGTFHQGHTANLWWGCTHVHEGCDNCYAETFSHRYHNDKEEGNKELWGVDAPRMAIDSVWSNLMKWQAIANKSGEVHRVFVGSMMDIFEKPMPLVSRDKKPINVVDVIGTPMEGTTGSLRKKFFEQILPNCPNLDFLLLTKRPSNINKYIPESWKANPPKNVMFGTSIVNPETLKTLGRQLQQVNGRKFFSIEPQLAMISPSDEQLAGIDWIIQGGESGHGKRPFSLDWIAPLRDACKANNVAYFFKQIDKVQEVPDWAMIREFPKLPFY